MVTHRVYCLDNLCGYDCILGRDVMSKLGLMIDFENSEVKWKELSVPFKDRDGDLHELHLADTEFKKDIDWMTSVLDNYYKKQDLKKVVASCDNLKPDEQDLLLETLEKHPKLFDGGVGLWSGDPYDLPLNCEDPKPP